MKYIIPAFIVVPTWRRDREGKYYCGLKCIRDAAKPHSIFASIWA
jgi:hypothetical protein